MLEKRDNVYLLTAHSEVDSGVDKIAKQNVTEMRPRFSKSSEQQFSL